MTSCMPPASSKKRSSTIVSCVGRQPSAACAAREIVDELLGGRRRRCRPRRRASAARRRRSRSPPQPRGDLGAQARHRMRQLVAAARRLAQPERDGRRRAVRILDAHDAALDAQDAVATCCRAGRRRRPGSRPRSPRSRCRRSWLSRLEQHLVVGVVGDRAAGGERGQPRAAPAAQHAVDRVVMEVARRAGRAGW